MKDFSPIASLFRMFALLIFCVISAHGIAYGTDDEKHFGILVITIILVGAEIEKAIERKST